MSQKNDYVQWVIWIFIETVISSQSIHSVSIKIDHQLLLLNQDFIFNSSYSKTLKHIVDTNMFFIYVWNDLSISMTLSHHIKLKMIVKNDEKDCYVSSIKDFKFAALWPSKQTDMPETQLVNDITIYDNKSDKVAALTAVMKIYLDLWCNYKKTVNILKTDYLQMSLKKN